MGQGIAVHGQGKQAAFMMVCKRDDGIALQSKNALVAADPNRVIGLLQRGDSQCICWQTLRRSEGCEDAVLQLVQPTDSSNPDSAISIFQDCVDLVGRRIIKKKKSADAG